ncbi:MAG: tRNA-dihydrouridine synthase family protein [Candidatus Diapherotrites archaeon]
MKDKKFSYCKIPINSPICLAPMVGYTNKAFRVLCKEQGAGFTFTEMTHGTALINNKEIKKEIIPSKEERPCGVQLVGENEKEFLQALELVEKEFDLIDLNFGCPANKILGSKRGAAHLKNLKKMKEIINAVCGATKKPVTFKTRIGFDKTETKKITELANSTNAKSWTLHGRTAKQGYTGKANWQEIKKAFELSEIPLTGNGDIESAKQGIKLIEQRFCNYAMIGRKAIGNPQVFDLNFLNLSEEEKENKRKELLKRFLFLSKKFNCDFNETKLNAMWFFKGNYGAGKIRERISKSKEIDELKEIIKLMK